MTDTAQSSKMQDGDVQNNTGSQVTPSVSGQISGAISKEHAPAEYIRHSDPMETRPEIKEELKEHGVKERQDEAKLELTREQQKTGLAHAPAAQTVAQVQAEDKPEFPMTHAVAQEQAKNASVWEPVRWLATLILKQMKIKSLEQKHD